MPLVKTVNTLISVIFILQRIHAHDTLWAGKISFPGLEHLLLFSAGEMSSASRLVVPPLIVSLYFEDDNENTSGMAPSALLRVDIRRWRTSLLHTSCRPGIGGWVLALSPSAATTTADSFLPFPASGRRNSFIKACQIAEVMSETPSCA